MAEHDPLTESRRFGRYLRRVREERKLSLDSVEEMTLGYPERITKSHLSRIENGQAIPTFPRMFALSQIYGVPISSLAERFESDLKYELTPAEVAGRSEDDILQEIHSCRSTGRYSEAVQLSEFLLEELSGQKDLEDVDLEARTIDLRLIRATCLAHQDRFVVAKDECENLLGANLSPTQQASTVQIFAMCCYRLGKYEMALMAIDRAERELTELAVGDDFKAHLATIKGNLYYVTGHHEDAIGAYQKALELHESLSIPYEACRTRSNLASALIQLGKYKAARRNLLRVLREAEQGGFERQIAQGLSNLALIAYKEGSLQAAEAQFLRSNSIARPREYLSVIYRNCFYLWKIAKTNGDAAGVRVHERTLRTYLGRVEEHLPEAVEYRAHLARGDDQ